MFVCVVQRGSVCTSAKLACVCWVACRSVFELVHATKLCFTIANKPTNCSASVCVCVCVCGCNERDSLLWKNSFSIPQRRVLNAPCGQRCSFFKEMTHWKKKFFLRFFPPPFLSIFLPIFFSFSCLVWFTSVKQILWLQIQKPLQVFQVLEIVAEMR